jgi:penicillin-binding protein 1A
MAEGQKKKTKKGKKLAQYIVSVASSVRKTITNPFKGEKPLHKKQYFWLMVGLGLGLGSGAIIWTWFHYTIAASLPKSVKEVLNYAREDTLLIKSADGEILAGSGPITYEKVTLKQVPTHLINAFIASEDRRFQEHHGFDVQGIVRAAWVNLQSGEVVEGASTITQQLARIAFLNQEISYTRKLKEMFLAQKIERELTKEQILQTYLNLVYLGSGAYGVADAAWVYFSKPVEELTLAEAATIAGITPAPSLYSPLENKEVAKTQRDQVLNKMVEAKLITSSEGDQAIASPLVLNPAPPRIKKAPYFVEYIQKELPKYISSEVLKSGGITVETTLNSQWQEAAETSLEKTLTTYGKWQRFQEGALVSLEPKTGAIKTMVGGKDFEKNQFNRVTQAQRQPGSTFKTFVYAAAIAGGFSPYRTYLDAEYTIDGYQPRNYGEQYRGGYVTLKDALTSSLNVVAVQTLKDVGWNPIITLAKEMGIQSPLLPTYSLALGSSEVNLLELTSAYGTLANKGLYVPPHGIERILNNKEEVIYQTKSQGKQALDQDSTAIVTWMLQSVVNNGTGIPAQIGRPVAGKTGTSDKARDLWFVGYIPQLTTGIWLGNDNNEPTWGASGTAAALWRKFMLGAVKEMPIEQFPPLPKLSSRKATIKVSPIKPKKTTFVIAKTSAAVDSNEQPREERRKSRRSRRRRTTDSSTEANSTNRYRVRRNSTVSNTRRRRATTSAPSNNNTSVTPSASPPTETAPLAPPAAPKEE